MNAGIKILTDRVAALERQAETDRKTIASLVKQVEQESTLAKRRGEILTGIVGAIRLVTAGVDVHTDDANDEHYKKTVERIAAGAEGKR